MVRGESCCCFACVCTGVTPVLLRGPAGLHVFCPPVLIDLGTLCIARKEQPSKEPFSTRHCGLITKKETAIIVFLRGRGQTVLALFCEVLFVQTSSGSPSRCCTASKKKVLRTKRSQNFCQCRCHPISENLHEMSMSLFPSVCVYVCTFHIWEAAQHCIFHNISAARTYAERVASPILQFWCQYKFKDQRVFSGESFVFVAVPHM